LRISNTYSPIYANAETNYPVYSVRGIYQAIDGDFNSYWKVDTKINKDNFTWLKISFSDNISAYGIRITAHKVEELWKGDKAKLEVSLNNKEWVSLLKLDLSKVNIDSNDKSILFPFDTLVTAKYFRLWIDDKQFSSLAEIELVDEPLNQMRQIRPLPFQDIQDHKNMIISLLNEKSKDVYTGWIDFNFVDYKTFNAVYADMDDPYVLNEATILLQISMDKTKWVTILQKSGYSFFNSKLNLLDKTVGAKYVRLQISNHKYYPQTDPISYNINIAEIKFLKKSPAKSLDTTAQNLKRNDQHEKTDPILSHNPNVVLMKTHNADATKLIRFENYHPNWKVYLDDKEVVLQKYGPNLQLISIPEGDHYVRMEYKSWYDTLVWLHVWFVALGWVGFIIVLAYNPFIKERDKIL